MGPAAVIPIFAAAAIGGELISNSSRSSQGTYRGSGGGPSLLGSGGGSSLPGSGGGLSLPGCGGGAIEAIASFGSGVAENVLVNTVGSFLKFGGSSVPSGNTSNITAIERKVNMTHYKEYVVTNKEAFDAMEALADELGTNTFATFLIKSSFPPKEQSQYENAAINRGYKGKVYHPTIQLVDGEKSIYIDWLMQGLNISQHRIEKAFPTVLKTIPLGKHTVKEVWSICKENSKNYFDLETNSCMNWGKKVVEAIKKDSVKQRANQNVNENPMINLDDS